MQQNNAAQKRPSKKPALASNVSQNTRNDPDFQASTQLAQGYKGCTPERWERGRSGCHLHLRLVQPASKFWPYDPCNSTTGRPANSCSGRNGGVISWALSLACAKPSPRGRIQAGLHGPRTCAGEGARSTNLAKATRTGAETCTKSAKREGQKTNASTTDATCKQAF